MTELSDVPTSTLAVFCGTVLLLAGNPFGQGLITLAVGMQIGQTAQ